MAHSGDSFQMKKEVKLQLILPSRLHAQVIRDLHEGMLWLGIWEKRKCCLSSRNNFTGQASPKQYELGVDSAQHVSPGR